MADREDQLPSEAELFEEALALEDDDRQRFLAKLEQQNPRAASRIHRLLAADQDADGSLLDLGSQRARNQALDVGHTPETIGNYRILERIGEGGMGIVYLAEQHEPVKRRVAIKIVRAGLDTEELLARFRSERQALALMNHNGIAQIFEAGTTESGRPYFAMEYVPGVPITRYCDDHRLSVDERLALLIEICDAVQHAHLKGIIHRDIKPENILVCEENDRPVPKIIDFGVAKALDQRLGSGSAHTRLGGLIGTYEYMSPEQAAASPVSVDTRADVYSLGAVLYELLVGERPTRFDPGKETPDQIRSSIRSEPILSLSQRLNAAADDAVEQVAMRRGTSGQDLKAEVAAELSWIAAKALSKSPSDRYQSARELAADLSAYLNLEPIVAAPDKLGYRIKSYTRRNKSAVLATLAIIASLVVGTVFSALGFVEARKERDLARQAQSESETTAQFLADMLSAANPENSGRDVTVREVLGQAVARLESDFDDRPLLAARLLGSIGDTYLEIGMLNEAASSLEKTYALYEEHLPADHPDYLGSVNELGRIYQRLGRHDEAIRLLQEAFVGRREVLGLYNADTIASLNSLGISYSQSGQHIEALQIRERVLELDTELHGPASREVLTAKNNLALSYGIVGRTTESLSLFREVVAGRTRLNGLDHPATLNTRSNLASAISGSGDHEAAVSILRAVIEDATRVLGGSDWRTLISKHQLARTLGNLGDYEAAEAGFLEVIEARMALFGEAHPETVVANVHYAEMLNDAGRHEEALPILRRSLGNATQSLPLNGPLVATYRAELGRALLLGNRAAEAYSVFERAHDNLLASVRRGEAKSLEPYVMTSSNLAAIHRNLGNAELARSLDDQRIAVTHQMESQQFGEASALTFLYD